MKSENNTWFNYIIFDVYKTYVGSTVNLDRRIRQHNGIIKGGAKYTRNGSWEYYAVIYNTDNDKKRCLSEEWHIKFTTNKVAGVYKKYKKFNCKNMYHRRQIAIEEYFRYTKFKYIIFISEKFKHLLPIVKPGTGLFIVNDFTHENIVSLINAYNKLKN